MQKCPKVSGLPSGCINLHLGLPSCEKLSAVSPLPVLPPLPHKCRSRMISRTSSPSTSSPDDGDCSFSFLPISKREYLLAQISQKDKLIDSLLKQVRLSWERILLTNVHVHVDYSLLSPSPASQSVSGHTTIDRGIPQHSIFV